MGTHCEAQSPAATLLRTPSSHLQPPALARAGAAPFSSPFRALPREVVPAQGTHPGVYLFWLPGSSSRSQQYTHMGSTLLPLSQSQSFLTSLCTHMDAQRHDHRPCREKSLQVPFLVPCPRASQLRRKGSSALQTQCVQDSCLKTL